MLRLSVVLCLCLCAPEVEARPPRTITIDMQGAEIGHVFRLLAEVSGDNLVYGDDVKGTITLSLKNVPWEQVLDVVCKTKGLGYERKGNLIRIAPQEALAAEERALLDAAVRREADGPLTTRLVPVNYARARELALQVKGLLSPRGTVSVDERTNTLIIRDVRGSPALAP